jgi:hypothetical protein
MNASRNIPGKFWEHSWKTLKFLDASRKILRTLPGTFLEHSWNILGKGHLIIQKKELKDNPTYIIIDYIIFV